jgi:hypothetical protein
VAQTQRANVPNDVALATLERKASEAAGLLKLLANENRLLILCRLALKGEMSVNKCLAKGMEFAIVDANGFVRILTPREIELTKKINPKAFETPGFGLKHYRLAPEIPPLPVSPEVQ